MAESFFSTLECKLLARRRFHSRPEARSALFSYLQGFYNESRPHTVLGWLTPQEFALAAAQQAAE
ncbi:hypothetical protein LKMONMHP_2459 [Methylobacterium organophilum]|uniref:Integrase catalytic domain-containing protein n=1 Tax=Methylobacterium organophilum TaxID=410 RepID=A0ABQ4T9C3_METOR|nr:hypothetical protein LKMONMHP_2459 [Methylobacterium organophilum]